MTIEQKAREIVAVKMGMLSATHSYWLHDLEQAARLGIIEGLEMALSCSQEVIDDMRINGDEIDLRTVKYRVAATIRDLIEGQKV